VWINCIIKQMISHDITLKKSDIKLLFNQKAILAFFTQLVYNTENHSVHNSSVIGFTGDPLAHESRSIELIADENGELMVYMIEFKILQWHQPVLARALRNWSGNFMLMLIFIYERLEYTLLEPVLPERREIVASQVYL
jgi:hypothetical protein